MTQAKLELLSDSDLIAEFVKLAEQRGAANEDGDVPRSNRAARQMFSLDDIFRKRGRGVRSLLLPLLDHRNEWVRYSAATRLLRIAPERARATIEQVAAGVGPIAGDAGMTLYELDRGGWKPD